MSESVSLPALGESVTEGTVTRWLKNVGDRVEVDEPLLEVSTDKVDTEIPSPVAGVIEAILVQEDETVEVGTPLVTIGDGTGAGAASTAGAASGAGAGAGADSAAGAASAAEAAASGAGAAGASAAGAACSAWAASGAAAGAAAPAPEPSPIVTRAVPTSTVSSSWTKIASMTPATGDGISVSTLSVETSSSGSSTSTRSPTFFSQRVTVPSVTLSPSAGRLTDSLMRLSPSQRVTLSSLLQSNFGTPGQLTWSGLPASLRKASPRASFWVGWAWMNGAMSSG